MASGLYHGDQGCRWWLECYGQLLASRPVSHSARLVTGLLANSISSWGDLYAKSINNFQGTFTKPGVEWDLYQIAQKKNESLRDYIKWFMKKKNTIPGVSDAVVMASFRTGVRDPDLLKKLARRQPETVKDLFDMADRYASQEEAMAAENDDQPR